MKSLPIKQESNVFSKLKRFFRNLFVKRDSKCISNNENIKVENKKTIDFSEALKEEVSYEFLNDYKKKDLLEEIENNPDLLKELSLERLEQLDRYYDQVIAEYKEKIDKIKRVG